MSRNIATNAFIPMAVNLSLEEFPYLNGISVMKPHRDTQDKGMREKKNLNQPTTLISSESEEGANERSTEAISSLPPST